ncbi:hypothetical protein UFOVP71_324 [uncultured Caudovirales phage]|uniref:Uncharacterized protein n=1 Tax=uncultured Caudovirales phage TaxID=2100421 RepID=A0A6J5TA42_9CAUD|nr:hypothetical protein UFOVP71_324 [uncultured Caudovirales phage]
MYKKITHTITEEHFGHPMATEIKKVIDKTIIVHPKPKMEPTTANKFRQDIANYFSSYNIKLDNIFKAIEASDDVAIADTEKVLFNEIDMIGDLFKPYYGIEFGERLNSSIRQLSMMFISIARNLKGKLDTKDWRQRVEGMRFELAAMLNLYNNAWRLPDVQNILGQIFSEIILLAQNIMNKSDTATTASFEKTANLLSVFDSQLSNGVIGQYPDKFIV